jgi:hypothetical protein
VARKTPVRVCKRSQYVVEGGERVFQHLQASEARGGRDSLADRELRQTRAERSATEHARAFQKTPLSRVPLSSENSTHKTVLSVNFR